MQLVRVGAASVNQKPLDWSGNVANILHAIDSANLLGVDLLCLPELCITGYGCEDHFHSNDVLARAFAALRRITQRVQTSVVCVGLPVMFKNAVYNVVAVVQDMKILGLVAKQHLAGDGLHYEPRWFKPWPAGHRAKFHGIPIGDLQFEFVQLDPQGGRKSFRVGFEICEDAWVADRPGSRLARMGVDIILNPSASHFAFGKYKVRQRFIEEGSRAFGATYVYANLLGNEAGRAIYDGGNMIATKGAVVAAGSRFSMQSMEITTAVIDIDGTRTQQAQSASFVPDHSDAQFVLGGRLYANPYERGDRPVDPPIELTAFTRHEEFTQAIALALFDYMRKSRSSGFVISLSGGADSAACALLVRKMVDFGIATFGVQGFVARLLGKSETSWQTAEEVTSNILTCVYQAARNSSTETESAAAAVAADAGAKFSSINIETLVANYTALVGQALGRSFSWEADDIALQNIQARTRSPSIWMIANVENKLLITTSNRSEAAVGYCTMDGDTSGSIAPIGGIDKHFLINWLKHLCASEQLPGLKLVLNQRPSAELRPEPQADELDLMPYDVLEMIEDLAVLEKKGPSEVFCVLSKRFTDSEQTIFKWVEKFFQLWARNQWKRERYALSFHVDSKNLDPRSWCRFPVLSGAFEEELLELKEHLAAD
jgi:NAD+ synthase (glutamine-hydrolysing)